MSEDFAFYGRLLSGTEQIRERWKRGVSVVENLMGDALGRMYVERHFPPAAKARMDELVANLREAYRVSINEFAASGWNSTLVGAITLPITAPVAGPLGVSIDTVWPGAA